MKINAAEMRLKSYEALKDEIDGVVAVVARQIEERASAGATFAVLPDIVNPDVHAHVVRKLADNGFQVCPVEGDRKTVLITWM